MCVCFSVCEMSLEEVHQVRAQLLLQTQSK